MPRINTTINSFDVPPTTIRDPHEEYNTLMLQYFSALDTSDNEGVFELERRILICMRDLGFFQEVIRAVFGVHRIYINHRYDPSNLTHRFVVLFIGYFLVPVENYDSIVNDRPLRGSWYHTTNCPIHARELDFISNSPSSTQDAEEDNMPFEMIRQSESIDFVINGQKVKLFLLQDPGSRYTSTISLHITSERHTNQRTPVRICRYEPQNVVLQRQVFQRPIHGLRFVRQQDGGGRILVKEIT